MVADEQCQHDHAQPLVGCFAHQRIRHQQRVDTRTNSNAEQPRRVSMVPSKIPATTSMPVPRFCKIFWAFSGVFAKLMISNFSSGAAAWTSGHSSMRNWQGVIRELPIRIMLSLPCMAFLAWVWASLAYWIMYLASW